MRRRRLGLLLLFAAGGTAAGDSKSSVAAQAANPERLIQRLAGVWKEEVHKRKLCLCGFAARPMAAWNKRSLRELPGSRMGLPAHGSLNPSNPSRSS